MNASESPTTAGQHTPQPRVSTPRLNLYSAVWEAIGHMSDEEIVLFVEATLRDVVRDEP